MTDWEALRQNAHDLCQKVLEEEPEEWTGKSMWERSKLRMLQNWSDTDPPEKRQRRLLRFYAEEGFLTNDEMDRFRERLAGNRNARAWQKVLWEIASIRYERVEKEKQRRKAQGKTRKRRRKKRKEPPKEQSGDLFA